MEIFENPMEGICTGIFSYAKISMRGFFARSPKFAVGNFTPTRRQPAFGKTALAILKRFLACCNLFLMGIFCFQDAILAFCYLMLRW